MKLQNTHFDSVLDLVKELLRVQAISCCFHVEMVVELIP